jgi:cobalt/nickel transport system permease protein
VHHRDLDRVAAIASPVHRLDPRVKAVLTLAFVIAVVRTGPADVAKLPAYALAWLGAALAARVPLRFAFRRALTALPFLAFIALFTPFLRGRTPLASFAAGPIAITLYREPVLLTVTILAKALLSVLAVALLVSTTRFHRLIAGLERLLLPRALCLTLVFLHRYLFVLLEEATAMKRARDARHVGRLGLRLGVRSAGAMVGALLVRTLERAERVAAAMRARGFDGEIRTLEVLALGPRDAAAVLLFAGFLGPVVLYPTGGAPP